MLLKMEWKMLVIIYNINMFIEKGFGFGGAGLGIKSNFMDENNKRERDKMKKNLFVGVDFIGDEEIRVNNNQKKISRFD
jgi:hypothetical protein